MARRHLVRSRIRLRLARCAVLCVGAAWSSPALAEGPPSEADVAHAAELKQAGDQAMDAFHYADALVSYEAAYKLSPSPALLYNEGRALQALNRNPEALAKIEAFKAVAPEDVRSKVPDLDKLVAELHARVGTLGVTCNVAGARVLLDRTVVGVTPLNPLQLNAGSKTVDVEAEGYFPYHEVVDLRGATALTVTANLSARDSNGILVITGSSPGADVTIDGQPAGAAPAEKLVPSGTHRVLLRHPSFADTEASVVVEAGLRKEVTVPLKAPSVVTRWWFWTSIGAALATAGAATAIALSTRGADSGTIPPGKISAVQGVRVGFQVGF